MSERGAGPGPLPDGGAVVVIGGGPGGTATAIALQDGARRLGRRLRVTLVEGKQFAGEQHHNQCAGVLSPPLAELLEGQLGVPFPNHLSRGAITGYVLHVGARQLVLDGHSETSVAMRRVQFDAYMLETARQRGVEVLHARVTDLEFHADRAVVYTDSAPQQADVVVGAFGLDEGTAAAFRRATAYRPPPALSSVVTKYHPGEAGMTAFGSRIHAFLPAAPGIEFGAITPKGNHLTINIAGQAVDARLMESFLTLPEVRCALPGLEYAGRFDPNDLRDFKGTVPCALAANYASDRFVMVGDAAGLVRAFKGKGVTSAVLTGLRAASAILEQGVSAQAFASYHAVNRDITDDLPYGRAVRRLTILAARLGLMDPLLRAAENEPGLRRALFDAVSAHRPYREVVREGLTRATVRAGLRAWLRPPPI